MTYAWRSVADLKSDSTKGSQIHTILSTGDFGYLARCALQIRVVDFGLAASFDLTRFAAGRDNLVLKLSFSDNSIWILRVPLQVDEDTSTNLLSEVTTMKYIEARTTIPVARIFQFEAIAGAFGFPYILMEYLPGQPTPRGLTSSVPREFWPKVAEQLAGILDQLSKLTFDCIGRLIARSDDEPITVVANNWHPAKKPLQTSLEYLYGMRYQENHEVYKEYGSDKQWNTACWILTIALAHTIIPDRTNGPFPLCHLDLFFGNILFDEEFNITGILDWSNAQTAPFEQLSVIPDLMLFMCSNKGNAREFKDFLVKAVTDLENHQQAADMKLSSFLASNQSEIYTCQYMNSAPQALDTAKTIARMIYDDNISWEQLVTTYGTLPVPRDSCTKGNDEE